MEKTNAEKFLFGMETVLKGYQIAEEIVTDDKTTHYMVMNKHIGDVFTQLQYMILFRDYYGEKKSKEFVLDDKSFKKAHLVKKIVIITNRLNEGITKLFSTVDDVVVLENEDLFCIGMYAKSMICVHPNLHRDDNGENCGYGWEPGTGYKSKLHNFKSYRWWLDLPYNISNLNEWKTCAYCLKNESINAARELLSSLNCQPEKAVILCPYAKSSSGLSYEELKEFIRYLHTKGYMVFTNVGAKEVELEQTIRLHVSVDVLVALGVLGGIIIGVQSGIIDVANNIMMDIRMMNIHYLKTPRDFAFAAGRKVSDPLEHHSNTTHLLIHPDEIKRLPDILKNEFSYIIKGVEQRGKYEKLDSSEFSFYQKTDLNEYLKEVMKMEDILCFLAVCDSANKHWDKVEKEILGIRSDLSIAWRRSFVAVVQGGENKKVIYEQMGENYKEVLYQSSFQDTKEYLGTSDTPSDNYYYVSSHAMGKNTYTKCAIVINGENYALNKRGLNVVVYSRKLNCVIDSIYTDLWSDPALEIRRGSKK